MSPVIARGEDCVNGYMREEDFIEYIVSVSIPGDTEVTNEQVRMGSVSQFSCTPDIYTRCTFRTPISGKRPFEAEERYAIFLYKDDDTQYGPPMPGSVFRDANPPTVTSLSVDPAPPEKSSDGTVTISYTVVDTAESGCTGVKAVEFYEDNLNNVDARTPVHTIVVDPTTGCSNPGDCSVTGTTEYTTGTTLGTTKLCALAYDKFGLYDTSNPKCIEFLVDRIVPAIVVGSINLTDLDGREVAPGSDTGYFKGSREIGMKIRVIDDSLGAVTADLSQLNPSMSYSSVAADNCYVDDPTNPDEYICEWQGIILEPDSDGTKRIIINASDTATPPNSAVRLINKRFEKDDAAPVVDDIKTSLYDPVERKSYVNASGTKIVAEITEPGVGIEKENIKLKVDSALVTVGNSGLAQNCTDVGTGWLCTWNAVTVNPNLEFMAKADVEGKDILENEIAEKKFNITFDTLAPRVTSIEITSDNPLNRVTSQDTLYVIANGNDSNYVYAYANLSGYIENQGNVPGQCESYDNGTWQCVWSGTIDRVGGYDVTSRFVFRDIVGNAKKETRTETLYERMEAVAPNFYYLDEAYMDQQLPKLPIDKAAIENGLAGGLWYQIVPFKLIFNTSNTGINPNELKIMNIRMHGCDGFASYGKDFITNNYNGFFQFVLIVTDIQAAIDADQTYMSIGTESGPCAIQFDVVYGTKTYMMPETEYVRVNIPIVDSRPEGETDSESLEDEIEEIEYSVDHWFGTVIEAIDTIIQVIMNICKIRNAIGTILQIVSIIGAWGAAGCAGGGPAAPPFCSLQAGASGLQNGAMASCEDTGACRYIRLMCDYVMCTGTGAAGSGETADAGSEGRDDLSRRQAYCDYLRYGLAADAESRGRTALRAAFGQSTLTLAKKSILFSIFCGCLTGFWYNLRKWRELKCWRAVCYRDFVPIGVPKDECDKQVAYQTCVYIMGEIMVMTGLGVINNIISGILNVLLDPLAAGWSLMKTWLYRRCKLRSGVAGDTIVWSDSCIPYAIVQLLTSVAELVQFFETFEEMEWEHETNVCGQLLEDEDDVTSD